MNGLLFPVDDREALKGVIMRGLCDEKLFDAALQCNMVKIMDEADAQKIRRDTQDFITTILKDVKSDD